MAGEIPRQCTLTSLWAKKPRFNDTSGAGLAKLPQDDAVPGISEFMLIAQ